MKARTDTREKIVELGRDLLQTVGYPSLSYQQISSKLGIKNAAVHYHFPGKENLGLDIINHDRESFEKFALAIADRKHWEKLDIFLRNYRTILENGNKICVIGASASDYAELPDQLRQAAAAYLLSVKQWFETLLENGRSEGAFHFKGEAKNKAAVIVSSLAGALQHARLIGNQHYDDVVIQVKLELAA